MSDWLPAFGTAQENFAQAQKWRGITHFGGVPGGQEPNFTKALHYYDACLRIEPAHEFAMSHRAICLWSLGRRAEARDLLSQVRSSLPQPLVYDLERIIAADPDLALLQAEVSP